MCICVYMYDVYIYYYRLITHLYLYFIAGVIH